MQRRGFFALLLAPIVARFLPAKQKPQGIDFETLERQYREGMLSADSTFDWFTDAGPFPFEPLNDPDTGISIRFVQEWDMVRFDELVPLDRLSFHPKAFEMVTAPLDAADVQRAYNTVNSQQADGWTMAPLKAGETITLAGLYAENPMHRCRIVG